MKSIYDHTQIGITIDDSFIENVSMAVEMYASDEGWIHSPHYPSWFSADGDDHNGFKEAIDFATETHFHIFDRHIQHHIDDRTGQMIQYHLSENDLYGIPDVDSTRCGYHIELEPKSITAENEELVQQSLRDAAHSINWLKSEALQIFFQTVNPCCWDGIPPRTRYGKDWIADTESRLICLIRNVPENIYKKCTYTGVTQSTLSICNGYLIETNYHGTETYHPLPPIDSNLYYPLDNKDMWKGCRIQKRDA